MRLFRFIPRFSLRSLLLLSLLGASGMLLWWNWQPWRIRRTFARPDSGYALIATSLGNEYVAAGDFSGTIHIWDIESGKQISSFRTPHRIFGDIVFSPDSHSILTNDSRQMCLWNASNGKLIQSFNAIADVPTWNPRFSNDGKHISCSDPVRVFNTVSGKVALELFTFHRFDAVDEDRNRMEKLNRANKLTEFAEFVHFYPDRVKEPKSLTDYLGESLASAVSNDGAIVVTAMIGDRSIQIWDGVTGKKLRVIEIEYGIRRFTLSASGSRLAGFTDSQNLLFIWETKNGNLRCELEGSPSVGVNVEFSGDDQLLFGGDDLGSSGVWSTTTGKKLFGVPSPFVSDGIIGLIGRNDLIDVMDLATGETLCSIAEPHGRREAFRPMKIIDRYKIITTDSSGELHVWHRRRPEWWWGIAWLPEFWLTLLFAGAFGWSVRCDRRELRKTAVSACAV
jgi:WD40 repeat protein